MCPEGDTLLYAALNLAGYRKVGKCDQHHVSCKRRQSVAQLLPTMKSLPTRKHGISGMAPGRLGDGQVAVSLWAHLHQGINTEHRSMSVLLKDSVFSPLSAH